MKEEMIMKLLEMLLTGEKTEKKEDHPFIGKYVVIRTYSAGVHIGYLKSVDGCEVILTEARQIFYWKGAFTLRELSQNGVSCGTKISIPVPEISLTKIEIIPCSKEQETKLKEYKSYEV